MMPWVARMAMLVVAALVLVATRFPGGSAWSVLAVVGGVLFAVAAAFSMSKRAPVGIGATVYVLGLSLLLVPTSDNAWLAVLPDGSAALLFVLALHLFFVDADADAPVVGSTDGEAWYRSALRFLPALLAVVLLFVLPWTSSWLLPARIHAAYELQGAMQPLSALVFLAAVLVVGGLLRSALAIGATDGHPAARGTDDPIQSVPRGEDA